MARFSGYGQQDACELLLYLLDLIHEDLNRVKKKPYIELPESDGRSDEVMSKLLWDAFLARNNSVIVDLMYGQLKSTVECLYCKNISTAFDPFVILPLPVPNESSLNKINTFKVTLVPYNMFYENQ